MKKLLFILFSIILLTSCKSVEYVQVPVEVPKIVNRYLYAEDSVYVHDSVFITEFIHGDTVYKEKDKWHTQYVQKTDSIIINDTITVPQIIKNQTVEYKHYWYEKYLVIFSLISLFVLIIKISRKFK